MARKEERAGRRAAGQVGTGEGWPMAGRAGTGGPGCRAPHRPSRPVRQGKKSGPSGVLRSRLVQGRVGLIAGRAGTEG
jgi:hypothetical protein